MTSLQISLSQLRGMIGVTVWHQGQQCRVIEVLEDGPSLVIQAAKESTIQTNQHGDPTRRVPLTYTIPVLAADGTELHASFLKLDLV
jgi:hypothetical protein